MRPQNSVRRSMAERFEDKFIPEPNSGCWLWMACINAYGYGQITRGERSAGSMLAHRASWELHHGVAPPADKMVCHHCNTRACVNPSHLFIGTAADNSQDCSRKGRVNKTVKARGEQHVKAKLTNHDVIMIRQAAGGAATIGERFSVSKTTVKSVRKRKTWGHVV